MLYFVYILDGVFIMKTRLSVLLFAFSYTHILLSFAGSLGHVTIADPILGPRDIVYQKEDGYAVVEGDILLEKLTNLKKQKNNTPQALILLRLGGDRWPQAVFPYEISENLPLKNKLAVIEAIRAWEKTTTIKFVEIDSSNRSAYHDYVVFIPTHGTTCSSFVGKQGGVQAIRLSARCNAMSTAHEIGHALGLWHEQSRADRDAYVRIMWENIEETYRYNFSQHITDGQDFGDYDYQSIMHYTPYAFSKNGEKTIIPLQDGVEIGQRNHLSLKDIAAINAMYSVTN